jgi:hypothetical protein
MDPRDITNDSENGVGSKSLADSVMLHACASATIIVPVMIQYRVIHNSTNENLPLLSALCVCCVFCVFTFGFAGLSTIIELLIEVITKIPR